MKIHEYQAKSLFRKFNIPVPEGHPCFSVEEAVEVAKKLSGSVFVVKAQIHAGGRGKGGGVKVAKNLDEVKQYASQIMGMQLVTHQTGPEGQKVRRLLVEQGADIKKEYYLAITLDRARGELCIMASQEGGMDIEEVAAKSPEKIFKEWVNPVVGLRDFQLRSLCHKMGLSGHKSLSKQFGQAVKNLLAMYESYDCSIVEVNPLIETADEKIFALDGKVNFDDNALYRHPDIAEMQDEHEEDPNELKAQKFDLSYVSLDGNIGCMVNGAGLAMGTMDIIKHEGGEPANFLDVGGGATAEKVKEAFKIILEDTKVKAILVNIFGGIMKCDVIAEGVISAAKELDLKIPLVVRLEGTNVDAGKKLLKESNLQIQAASGMKEAATLAVKAAGAV